MIATKSKPCGDCHRCCEGYLWGSALGHQFRTGKPCGWLGPRGCLIYPNHPQDPCKSFVCGWKSQAQWPDHMRPNVSNVIFVARFIEQHSYWYGVNCSKKLDHKVFDWALQHLRQTGQNLLLTQDDGFVVYTQDQDFLAQVKNKYPTMSVIWQS